VHRLDRQTSGVLLVAKTRDAHARLAHAFQERRVEKDYLALVLGRVAPVRGTIVLAVACDPRDRRRVVVVDRGGRESSTRYERLVATRGRKAGLALLRCRLITGRMHQIRVHLAASGWPIVGDRVYGRPGTTGISDPALDAAVRGFERQALHAWRLAFDHPLDGRPVEVIAPVPDDIATLLGAADIELAVR
jgi:23S rRNA pseudouridine1911/1915/1917 synthase